MRASSSRRERRLLTRFPDAYEQLIKLARDPDLAFVTDNAKAACDALIRDLRLYAVAHHETAGSASQCS